MPCSSPSPKPCNASCIPSPKQYTSPTTTSHISRWEMSSPPRHSWRGGEGVRSNARIATPVDALLYASPSPKTPAIPRARRTAPILSRRRGPNTHPWRALLKWIQSHEANRSLVRSIARYSYQLRHQAQASLREASQKTPCSDGNAHYSDDKIP